MRRAARTPALLAAVAVTGVAALSGGSGAGATVKKPPTTCKKVVAKKTVKIGDNFYLPDTLRVKRCTKVTWVWPSEVGDTHDVKLTKRPKGVKAFLSQGVATDYRYPRTLAVTGAYHIVCTFHEGDMEMNIKVL